MAKQGKTPATGRKEAKGVTGGYAPAQAGVNSVDASSGAKRPSSGDQAQGLAAAKRNAARVSGMTAAERRAEIAWLSSALLNYAPTLAAAESDPLKALLVIGAMFVQRYWPDATDSSFHVSRYGKSGPPEYTVMIPLAVPVSEAPAVDVDGGRAGA